MKAIDLAIILHPVLSKQDIIKLTCPDKLLIVDSVNCSKNKSFVDDECISCWNVEVSQSRVDWLMECKKWVI